MKQRIVDAAAALLIAVVAIVGGVRVYAVIAALISIFDIGCNC